MSTGFSSKYKVLHKIGEGSFSEVLKCEDRNSGIQFAAKRLKKLFKTREEILSCAEVVAMKKVEVHPNVLQIEHLPGKIVFIFELMDMSMYDYMKLKRRCIAENKVKNYLYQMLKGLDHLHRSGLFHRDIKPENVLIKILNPINSSDTKCEVVKLADLGSIRGIYSNPPYTEYISTRWYRSPECLLTVGYYGPKMDIWAAGCVFYEMLTLRPLFPGTDEIDQLSKIHTILGTPTTKLLNKLKEKSRNCQRFPKLAGFGLHSVISNVSEEGFSVLKLMVQYDPDNRTNVKRLLEHKYFNDLRHEDLLNKYNAPFSLHGTGGYNKRQAGDYNQISTRFYPPVWKPKKKSTHYSNSNEAKRRTIENHNSVQCSKTSLDMIGHGAILQPKPHFIKQSKDPLVGQKQMKSWGVDPTILKPPDKGSTIIHAFQKESPSKLKPWAQKKIARNHSEKPTFRKTTSDLPQVLVKGDERLKSKQFQSKSFVLPWRVAGRSKLNTIEELKCINSLKKHTNQKKQ